MRPVAGVAIVICFVAALVVVLLCLLRRARFTAVRLLLALFTGLLTDYALRALLFLGDSFVARWAELGAWAYRDLCGLRAFKTP